MHQQIALRHPLPNDLNALHFQILKGYERQLYWCSSLPAANSLRLEIISLKIRRQESSQQLTRKKANSGKVQFETAPNISPLPFPSNLKLDVKSRKILVTVAQPPLQHSHGCS